MSSFDDAVKAVSESFATKQNAIEWKPATTGDGHGLVDAGNGMVYVRLTENSSVIQVINGGISLQDGVLCRIEKPAHDPLHWYAVRATDQRIDENGSSGGSSALNVGPHHLTHQYLGVDQVDMDWRQITNMRVYASSGFVIGVLAGLIPRVGADLVVPTQTLDLTSHVPASGALYVLISVDPVGALAATDGVTVGSLLDLTLGDIPDTPDGNFRLAAVRLYYGQTSIRETTVSNDIRDLRWPQETTALPIPGATAGISTYYLENVTWITTLKLNPVHVVNAAGSFPRTGDNVSTSIFVQSWSTTWNYPGLSMFPAGLWTCTFEAESTGSVQFYFKVFRSGSGTAILTSDLSSAVTTHQVVTLTKSSAALAITSTEQIRLEIYIYNAGTIPNTTTATIYYDGSVDSHLSFPPQSSGLIALTTNHILVGNASNQAADVAMSNDATIAASGALTLKNTGPGATGPIGSATVAPVVTIDAQGRVTALSSATITGVSPIGSALTRGSILVGNASNLIAAVAKGAANAILTGDGTDTAWSGYTLAGTTGQAYTLGTTGGTIPTAAGTLTVSTTNAISAAGVITHTVTASDDVSAGTTALLKSNAGALTLATLTIPATSGSTAGVIYMGATRLISAISTKNIFVGIESGNFTASSATGENVGLGYRTLYSLTTGTYNLAIASQALINCQNGTQNVAIGALANYLQISPTGNTSIGFSPLQNNTSGDYSTAIGYQALRLATGSDRNTAVGASAMYSSDTALRCTAVGAQALYYSNANYNVGVGYSAGQGAGTYIGTNNTLVGSFAGFSVAGSSNVMLGYSAGYYETGTDKLFVDNRQRASEADGRVKALLYGVFDAAVANQRFTANALTGIQTTMIGSGVTYQALNVNGSQLFVGADSSQESPMLQIVPSYATSTHASYKARAVVSIWDIGGARNAIQIDTDGSNPTVQINSLPYGSMYVDDASISITVGAANTEVKITTGLTGGTCHQFTFQNNSELLCAIAGKYKVDWGMSVSSGTNNENLSGGVVINTATWQHNTEGSSNQNNSNNAVHIGGSGIITLAVNDTVGLFVENESAAHDMTVRHANLSLVRVGA